jgi:serine/threonine protein kinase
VPEAILSKWMMKVLKGLYYLHKKMHMVHRDIKPANILLSGDGDPKITAAKSVF